MDKACGKSGHTDWANYVCALNTVSVYGVHVCECINKRDRWHGKES